MNRSGESTSKNRWASWWDGFSTTSKTLLIGLAAPLLVLNFWAFSTIFSYFRSLLVTIVIASLLAFLLSYPVNWLERRGLPRAPASILVFLIAVLAVLVLGVTLLPPVIAQAQQLLARLPEWFDSGRHQLLILDERIEEWGWPISFDGVATQIGDRLKMQLQLIAGKVLNLTLGVAVFTASTLVDILLTVILTLYLMQHSREVWESLVSWLPTRIQTPFSATLRRSFQNYFIGQLIVATCMAAALMSIFAILKVPFGLLFGFTIGLMALVPLGGTVGIILVTFLVALRDIGIAVQVILASVVVQQIIENGLAPRVLGSVTGLNPFWVLIALLAGARVGGLLGIVVAVPTAVVIREAIDAVRSVRQKAQITPEEASEESPQLATQD